MHMQDRRQLEYFHLFCCSASGVIFRFPLVLLTLYVYSANAVKDCLSGAKKLHILAMSHHELE